MPSTKDARNQTDARFSINGDILIAFKKAIDLDGRAYSNAIETLMRVYNELDTGKPLKNVLTIQSWEKSRNIPTSAWVDKIVWKKFKEKIKKEGRTQSKVMTVLMKCFIDMDFTLESPLEDFFK